MEKKYFYINRYNVQVGPCSVDELREAGIVRETMVWCAPMTDWVPAGRLPELGVLFGAVPPPVLAAEEVQPSKPDSWLIWSILATVMCCVPFGVVGIVYASKVDTLWAERKYDEAVAAARSARTWTLTSIVVTGVFLVLYILFWILMVFGIIGGAHLFPSF